MSFFFQAEDGIRDIGVAGVQTCALPILVHVATEGKLQVKGTLTEYDLANIKVGQAVKIKSKVYADQEWTGKISYVSNYPTDANAGGSAAGGSGSSSSTGATYDYKIDITSPLNQLKQGFTVSVEVINERSEEHTSELQSRQYLVCRLLLEKKK